MKILLAAFLTILKITEMSQIIVKSLKPNGLYKKSFNIKKDDLNNYEKDADVAMEVMTRAVEEVVKDCKEKSGGASTTSKCFVKHFFSSFGPIIWAYEESKEDDSDSHYTTLTELALRNAGYSNLSSFVNKCTKSLQNSEDLDFYEDSDEDDLHDGC